jgi:AP-1 complex subunit mu
MLQLTTVFFFWQYLYIRHSNLYVLALTKRNTNATEILLFLHKIVEVFTEYFKELEEESIRDNFVVIYELLDEMMDFGYPQTTESKILQESVEIGLLINAHMG